MLRVCGKKEFIDRVENIGQIICFGAGKRIENFKEFYQETNVFKKISFFVDNNIEKQKTIVNIGDKNIGIISFKELRDRQLENTVILIITAEYMPILLQLEQDSKLKNVDCYCLTHQLALMAEELAMKKSVPDKIRISDKPLIPKVIHYCWFGKNPIPDQYKKWMESWKKFCPDYEIIEWNEKNYDITKNKYMVQAYENKKWGFVPDFARLDIIYHYGGIYLDTDVELIQNVDDLLYQKGFAGFEGENYVALGLGFGAEKGLPIIREMLEHYNNIDFVNKDGKLNLIASPVWQTELLLKKGLKLNGEYQIVKDLTIFPEKMLTGKNLGTRRVRLMPYTRSIHHYEGSWLDIKGKKNNLQLELDINNYT